MNLQINYSQFISHLKSQDIQINRKIISQIAIYDRVAFEQIINQTLVTEVV
jgi:ribosomal protein L20